MAQETIQLCGKCLYIIENSLSHTCVEKENAMGILRDALNSNNDLQTTLRIERIKNGVISCLLEKFTELRAEDLFSSTPQNFTVYNSDVKVSIKNKKVKEEVVATKADEKEDNKEVKTSGTKEVKTSGTKEVKTETKQVSTKERYASLSGVAKKDESENDTIRNIILQSETPETYTKKDILKDIEGLFAGMTRDNIDTVSKDIYTTRMKLLSYMSIEEYSAMLQTHLIRFKNMLTTYTKSRLKNKLLQLFNPYESRLLSLNNYYSSSLTVDDISWVKESIAKNREKYYDFISFDSQKIFSRSMNINLSVFSLRDMLRSELRHDSGFNNIIYINLEKNNQIDDPYSFYYLEKIENGNRLWRLDNRLLEISYEITDTILPYCINLFRKIYYDIYSDNEYRQEFWTHNSCTEMELQQIVATIMFLSNTYEVCTAIQQIVMENLYTPSHNDKFNLRADDKQHAKRFQELRSRDYRNEILSNISQLFDDSCGRDYIKHLRI